MKQALVVDDQNDARTFVRTILEAEGWTVDEAADGKSALEKARSLRPGLIVLDVLMPERDGFHVFDELARDASTTHAKFIMLTAVGEKAGMPFSDGDMGEYFGRRPDAYVEKPILPEAFKRVLQRVTPAA